MANLIQVLRQQNYDFIFGTIRNHKLLQVWLKKKLDRNDFYDDLKNIFDSDVNLISYTNPALFVNYSASREFNIGLGVSFLEDLLKSTNLGNLEAAFKLGFGKKISVSFSDAFTEEYAYGNITNFFTSMGLDFKSPYPNQEFIKFANNDSLLLITGVLSARNLKINLTSDLEVTTDVEAKINQFLEGKIDFQWINKQELEMSSPLGALVPIAVKAYRLLFDKGEYVTMSMVTDNRGDLF